MKHTIVIMWCATPCQISSRNLAWDSLIGTYSCLCVAKKSPKNHKFGHILKFGAPIQTSGLNLACKSEPVAYSTMPNFALIGMYCYSCVTTNCRKQQIWLAFDLVSLVIFNLWKSVLVTQYTGGVLIFSPRRRDKLHRWSDILAWRFHSSTPNFNPSMLGWGVEPPNWNFYSIAEYKRLTGAYFLRDFSTKFYAAFEDSLMFG